MSSHDDTIHLYSTRAAEFFDDYDSLNPADFHAPLLPLLPDPPARVLDIGAGTGRDAAFLAARGFEVIAVEPAGGFREQGSARHQHPDLHWLDDRLPDLPEVRRRGLDADVVWLSAVWMHVDPADRGSAFRTLVSLLRPGGRLIFNLRVGPAPADRPMFPNSSEEIVALGEGHGLRVLHHGHAADTLGRPGVHWENLVLAL